jgi:transketolase
MARYGGTYGGVDEPAPADPVQRSAQAEANLRIAMTVLRSDTRLVEFLSDRLLAIAATVPDRVESFNLGGRAAELLSDPRLTDFRAYPKELYKRPGEHHPNRAALGAWGA